jgi:serine phosphatase RsbU (regulator of sigma subunit)/pSer/pThr/pTyr-binding forkhead associated (FHA) protein
VTDVADLRYMDQAGRLQVQRLGHEHFLIGRANTCQVVFIDDAVSREHARLDRDRDGRYRIRDLGSRNKTLVNGQQIAETVLASGDIVRIGDHVLEFFDEEAPRERLALDFLTPDRSDPAGTEWVKIKTPVTLSLEQVEALAGLSWRVGPTSRAEEIAEAALSRLILDLQAERGFIARRGEAKTDLVPVSHRGLALGPGGGRVPVSQTFVFSAVLQQVAGRYPQSANQMDPKAGYAATAVVAPLLHQRDIIGLVYVDRVASKQPFSAMALQQVMASGAAIGGLMADAARRLAAQVDTAEAAWMSAIRRLQASMSVAPSAKAPFEAAHASQPGRFRCGDLCDLIQVDEGKLVMVVLDAGGSGVAGFSQAAAIRAGIRTTVGVTGDVMDLAPMMNELNRVVSGQSQRQLVTCLVAGIDLASGRIAYVNAGGMPPLLLAGPGRLITLDQTALLLGIDPDYNYETSSVDLPPSFRVICHSDGVTDTTNAAGEAFGEQRLHELLLTREVFAEPPTVVQKITEAVSSHSGGHPGGDDATMLVVGKG